MDGTSRTFSAPVPDPGRWIGRLLIAVILGEGIWGLIVSVTNNLIVPFLARIMGTDARSPLSLGNGQFNFPGLFTSVLHLCFAGIAAVILNSWVQRKPKPTRSRPATVRPLPLPSAAPRSSPPPVQAAATAPSQIARVVPPLAAASPASSSQFWSPPESSLPQEAAPPPAKPPKPTPPKEVYYNTVGDPINPTEE